MAASDLFPEAPRKLLSRRSILKGSMSLTAAAIAAPAFVFGAVETAAPAIERVALEIEEWFEEVGGI